jgi:hypothetical protein
MFNSNQIKECLLAADAVDAFFMMLGIKAVNHAGVAGAGAFNGADGQPCWAFKVVWGVAGLEAIIDGLGFGQLVGQTKAFFLDTINALLVMFPNDTVNHAR